MLAVVSHGLVCRAIVKYHLRLGPGVDASGYSWANTALTVIDGPPWEARLLACTAHLDDLPPD